MIWKSRELYNVIHQTWAGKLRTKIISLTKYNQLGKMKEYRKFVKLFHMAMNEPMNAYRLRLYVNDRTSYENPTTYYWVTSTVSYKPTYKYKSTRTDTKK